MESSSDRVLDLIRERIRKNLRDAVGASGCGCAGPGFEQSRKHGWPWALHAGDRARLAQAWRALIGCGGADEREGLLGHPGQAIACGLLAIPTPMTLEDDYGNAELRLRA